jgi:K+-transporting ATPase ATPase C chain
MLSHIRAALVMLGLMTVTTGVVYPLLVTGIAQAAFPGRSNGSIIYRCGTASGSALVGQPFSDPGHFWGRLSATAPTPFNAGASTGSNLGPANPELFHAVKARIDALRAADPEATGAVPIDLVTASGSGLDPHISPAAADFQVRRVARARGMREDAVRWLVEKHTQARQLGILGEPVVNVLELNLALEER